jgi:hypothetical protein
MSQSNGPVGAAMCSRRREANDGKPAQRCHKSPDLVTENGPRSAQCAGSVSLPMNGCLGTTLSLSCSAVDRKA